MKGSERGHRSARTVPVGSARSADACGRASAHVRAVARGTAAHVAVTARLDCRIHFALDGPTDGEPCVIENAFTYDWRLWTLPDVLELLREAGFSDARVWRHTHDPARGREGVFFGPVEAIEDLDTWTAYVVGVR
jgi:hypothetical protein